MWWYVVYFSMPLFQTSHTTFTWERPDPPRLRKCEKISIGNLFCNRSQIWIRSCGFILSRSTLECFVYQVYHSGCETTHWVKVAHICTPSGHHWFRWYFRTCSVTSHYLNQRWFIVNTTLGSKYNNAHARKLIWKWRLLNGGHFVS